MTSDYPYYDPYSAPQPSYPLEPPAPPAEPKRPRTALTAGIAALLAAALATGVTLAVDSHSSTVNGSGALSPRIQIIPGHVNRGGSGTSTGASLATAAQQKGIVTVVSVLRYQNAESAGTGMILTSNGEVLTNNHVIDGATSITVTVVSTGRSYRASVVGTDASDDVAVLQMSGASGLTTANLGNSSSVAVGDAITGVGNAGGTGTLRAAPGRVTALNQSITATDEFGQGGERLTGLIKVQAGVVSGDSGGPLYNASGAVVGMDTAASTSSQAGFPQQNGSAAYAIPIDSAVSIANSIESGVRTAKIHIGLPAFIGVGVGPQTGNGATVISLLPGGPAAGAGITSGSVITAVDGHKITSPAQLKSTLGHYRPGQRATISWTDAGGNSHSVTMTLATGPAD